MALLQLAWQNELDGPFKFRVKINDLCMELGPLTRSYSTFILLSSLSYINIVLSSLRGYLDSQAK